MAWLSRIKAALEPWLAWIVIVWSLGVLVCSLRPLLGWHTLSRLKRVGVSPVSEDVLAAMRRVSERLGLRRAVSVLQSTLAQVPVVVGYMRPVILLPVSLMTSLPSEQLEAILAHELAHVRRHDFVVNLLQTLVETLFFYHPAVWWLSRQIRVEREHCCDDLVVTLLGNRVEYGRALLAIEELRGQSTVLALGATDGSLLSRVRRIAGINSDRAASSLWSMLCLAICCLGVILGLSALGWHGLADESRDDKTTANIDSRPDDNEVAAVESTDSSNKDAASKPDDHLIWGDPVNGLRARVVPVQNSMRDDAIDPDQRVTKFAKADDVAFAVEIENVSDKPIKLLDARNGNGNTDWNGQFLFSIDLFDQNGKPIERSEVQVVDLDGVLNNVFVATLEPGKTHRVLLRPAKWLSPFQQRIAPGNYRAAVRYHGLPARVAARIKEYQPESPALAAVAENIVTSTVAFEVSRQPVVEANPFDPEPTATEGTEPAIGVGSGPIRLVWGNPTNGLRAALEFLPQKATYGHGEKPEPKLHVQNVSDKPITLSSLLWLSELKATVKNDKGEPIDVGSVWYTGRTMMARVTLKPQQVIIFDAGNVGLAVSKERADKFEHMTHRKLIAPAGKYSMQLEGRFGNSVRLEDGKGNVLAPLPGDWIGELKTGAAPLTISNEIIECDIVDADTGKPIADTTTSFLFIKPKSADSEETTVAHLIWGPKGPGHIYFTIPDQVMQRADREELEVRWGTGNHPDYENYWPAERIKLRQFFQEETKSARETLSTIKLTPKKKAIESSPPVGLEFLKPYPKLHGLSLDMTESQFLEIVKQQELKTRKTVDGEKITHHITLGDDHTLIVMVGKNGKCSGIQRVRGEDREPIRVMLKLDRKEFLLGESIAVEYEMTNDGNEEAPYGKGGFYPDLRINDGFRMSAVKVDENGKPVAEPVGNWPMPENFGGPVGGFKLKSGENYSTTLFATRYLRLLEPGHYRLRVENVDRLERDPASAYSKGETYLTLKQPTPEEARGVFERMKKAPRQAYDDNAMTFLPKAADFQAMHQPVYLPILKEFATKSDLDALQSLERMERIEANEVLVAALATALDRDDWQAARVCFQHLKKCLPFPNWYNDPLNDYDQANRDRVARTWRADFVPVLTRLAKRLNVEVTSMMRDRTSKPRDADANDREFLKVFRNGFFPQTHPQSLLIDIDFIYRCVGQPEDFPDCLAAFAHSIELTKTLPLETNQYFRPRGSAYGFGHTVFRMIERGAQAPNKPAHPGEAAAFAIALRQNSSFRPDGWQAEIMKWLKHDSPYLAELILGYLPDPVPNEVFEYLPTALAHDYIDLQIAACHVAKKHPHPAYREPLQKILDTAKDPYLRKYAVDAARANGIKAKYDPDAPFVDAEKENAEAAAQKPVANESVSLSEVVRDFNKENKQLGRGLDQPSLTEDEVVEFIKRSDKKRDAEGLNEKEFATFKAVAESKQLPKDSYLQVYTEQPRDTFVVSHFWQVRLMLPAIGHDGFVGLTIRDTKIAEEKIDPKSVAWGKPDADGLALGAYLSPKKDKYALGERVRLRLFVRNDGKQAVKTTWANTSHPMPEDFTVTDEKGVKVAVRKGQDGNWELPWISGFMSGGLGAGDVHRFEVPYEISFGGDGSNKLVGRIIDARPGQKLQLKVRESNGNNRERKEGEAVPETGNLTFTVADAANAATDAAQTATPEEQGKAKIAPANDAVHNGRVSGTIRVVGHVPTLLPSARWPAGGVHSELLRREWSITDQRRPTKGWDESLLVSKEQGLANTVIYLRMAPKGFIPEPSPSEPFVLTNDAARFSPHVAVMRAGQPILLKNTDSLAINFHSQPLRGSAFNVVVGPEKSLSLGAELHNIPERFPFKIVSDLEPWKQAFVLPLDHPFVAVTDSAGRFEIAGLPAGQHDFIVWHERAGYLEKKLTVTVKEGKTTNVPPLSYELAQFKLEQWNNGAAARWVDGGEGWSVGVGWSSGNTEFVIGKPDRNDAMTFQLSLRNNTDRPLNVPVPESFTWDFGMGNRHQLNVRIHDRGQTKLTLAAREVRVLDVPKPTLDLTDIEPGFWSVRFASPFSKNDLLLDLWLDATQPRWLTKQVQELRAAGRHPDDEFKDIRWGESLQGLRLGVRVKSDPLDAVRIEADPRRSPRLIWPENQTVKLVPEFFLWNATDATVEISMLHHAPPDWVHRIVQETGAMRRTAPRGSPEVGPTPMVTGPKVDEKHRLKPGAVLRLGDGLLQVVPPGSKTELDHQTAKLPADEYGYWTFLNLHRTDQPHISLHLQSGLQRLLVETVQTIQE